MMTGKLDFVYVIVSDFSLWRLRLGAVFERFSATGMNHCFLSSVCRRDLIRRSFYDCPFIRSKPYHKDFHHYQGQLKFPLLIPVFCVDRELKQGTDLLLHIFPFLLLLAAGSAELRF